MRFGCPPKTGRLCVCPTLRSILILLRFYLRRRRGSKFAVADFAASICDVTAGGQPGCSEQNHRDRERDGRFRPAQRSDDRSGAQSGERIENVDNFLSTLLMVIEPSVTVVIGHSQNAIVSLLAKFEDRPCGNRSDEY